MGEVYGRREKRGRKTGYPRGRESGEIGDEFRNILPQKKLAEAGTSKEGGGNREYKA